MAIWLVTYKYNNGYLTEIYGQYGISEKMRICNLEERQAMKKIIINY